MWHHSLNKLRPHRGNTFTIYKQYIYSDTCNVQYTGALYIADHTTLAECRKQLCHKFFYINFTPLSCLHHLLAALCDAKLLLMAPSKFLKIPSQRERYQSFIFTSLALAAFQ